MEKPYDPLDYENLAKSIVSTLLERKPASLPLKDAFEGPGVYAIYYSGNFEAYSKITTPKFTTPIYVGKAIPPGGRKGVAEIKSTSGRSLFSRLNQHAGSIGYASNLQLEDFACRYLIVLPVWVGLAEQFLIDHYHPIWNLFLDGFGNHNVGEGRRAGKKPRWDIVHPGRPWAKDLTAKEKASDLIRKMQELLAPKS